MSADFLKDRLYQYYLLMRLHRPIGIFLVLWPALWALWIAAEGWPDGYVLTVFLLGSVLMRSAGCVINDFADRNIDPHVERTRERPLATGRVTAGEALGLFVLLSLAALILLLTLDPAPLQWAMVAVVLVVVYPFTKRATHLPQVFLGAAFACAVPMAFVAEGAEVNASTWLLFVAAIAWALVYDTQYAMVDREDDLRIGVKSTAILFAGWDRVLIAVFQLLVLLLLLATGLFAEVAWPYYAALAPATGLFVYQQWLTRGRGRAACFQAFLNNQWFGAAIFAGVVLAYL